MYIYEVLEISVRSIISNGIRSLLTTLGIVIGIAAVIAMISVGQGAQEAILEQAQGIGSNTVSIIPSTGLPDPSDRGSIQAIFNNKIDHQVLNRLENEVKFREITGIAPILNSTFEVSVRSRANFSTVYGTTESYLEVFDLIVNEGRFLSEQDEQQLRKVAVLGNAAVEDLFGENDPINRNIRIGGSNYKVIGTLDPKSDNQDDLIFIPLSTASNILIGDKDLSQITVEAESEDIIDSLATKIEEDMMDYYRISDPDDAMFTVITSKEIANLVGTITSVFTTLLASIASISLIVGGIGIMNIMLVSVSERTKEIGLRKAVGAKQNAILGQFLTEALVLTLIGGIIGILFGIVAATVVGQIGDIPVVFTIESIILATSVSAIIGIVFGFYPAYRAARLNPIDALRYE